MTLLGMNAIKQFQTRLADAIAATTCRIIHVDYDPDPILVECFTAAFGERPAGNVFPIKTIMWIAPGSVLVEYGYGGSRTQLMP
jgi:hypothetical protein